MGVAYRMSWCNILLFWGLFFDDLTVRYRLLCLRTPSFGHNSVISFFGSFFPFSALSAMVLATSAVCRVLSVITPERLPVELRTWMRACVHPSNNRVTPHVLNITHPHPHEQKRRVPAFLALLVSPQTLYIYFGLGPKTPILNVFWPYHNHPTRSSHPTGFQVLLSRISTSPRPHAAFRVHYSITTRKLPSKPTLTLNLILLTASLSEKRA